MSSRRFRLCPRCGANGRKCCGYGCNLPARTNSSTSALTFLFSLFSPLPPLSTHFETCNYCGCGFRFGVSVSRFTTTQKLEKWDAATCRTLAKVSTTWVHIKHLSLNRLSVKFFLVHVPKKCRLDNSSFSISFQYTHVWSTLKASSYYFHLCGEHICTLNTGKFLHGMKALESW